MVVTGVRGIDIEVEAERGIKIDDLEAVVAVETEGTGQKNTAEAKNVDPDIHHRGGTDLGALIEPEGKDLEPVVDLKVGVPIGHPRDIEKGIAVGPDNTHQDILEEVEREARPNPDLRSNRDTEN